MLDHIPLVMGREATSDVEVVLASLASSFARIHELPNLKSLTLSFPCLTGNLTSMEPLRLQWTILSVLSSRSPLPSVTSVNITGMTALYHPVYDLPSFRSLFGSLTSLSIGAAISHDLAEPQFRDPFIKFWEETFQHRMLGSVSHSLTSLKLSSSSFVGVVPRLDFSQVNFPALELLSLKRILFNMDTHIEDFIVRHKGTLRTLWLMDCKIAILGSFEEPEGAPHRWSHIWARFAKELGALVDFDMLSGYRYSARPIHYARIWPGYWNVAVAWYLHYMDEGEPALEALRQLVRSRAAEQAYVRGQSVANWLIDIE